MAARLSFKMPSTPPESSDKAATDHRASERAMESSASEPDSPLYPTNPNPNPNPNPSFSFVEGTNKKKKKKAQRRRRTEEREEEESWWGRRGGGAVMLEGYVEPRDGGDRGSDGGVGAVGRTRSLTDEDLEELKGCLDLGFGFSYDEIPELCGTLPALELCYSMSQRFLDEQQQAAGEAADSCVAVSAAPVANWKFSSPGDHPEDVKARLKYWAQAVACTVKLCN